MTKWLLAFGVTVITIGFSERPLPAQDTAPGPGTVEAKDVFFRTRESADVPALERGALQAVHIELGQMVIQGQIIAVLDDAEARLNLDVARLDLAISEKRQKESVAVAAAQANRDEAAQMLEQARAELKVARAVAEADIGVRQAKRDAENSQAELDRAIAVRQEFSSSISEQQMAKLTLARDQDRLKLEKAQHDQKLEQSRLAGREAVVEQQIAALGRLQLAISEAETEAAAELLNLQRLAKAVAIGEERLQRRSMKAPFGGIIVEQHRYTGEWMEVGEPLVRIMRLDRLYVEGYVRAGLLRVSQRGQKVTVEADDAGRPVRLQGTIVFVSPEVDPANQEVLIKAEVENPGLQFMPGQPARMWVSLPQSLN